MKIFLSPSNQTANRYSTQTTTNECVQCTRIAKAVEEYLQAFECDVQVAEQADNMTIRTNKAKEWGADFYIAIHTNASSDKSVYGTETFFHSADVKGHTFASELLNDVSALTGRKRRCRAYDGLIELNSVNCTRAYIEVDFHSNPTHAEWIVDNVDLIAKTISERIVAFFDLPLKATTVNDYTIAIPSYEDYEKVVGIMNILGIEYTSEVNLK